MRSRYAHGSLGPDRGTGVALGWGGGRVGIRRENLQALGIGDLPDKILSRGVKGAMVVDSRSGIAS